MKRYIVHMILIAIVAVVFVSCSTGRYSTTRVQNLDFGKYKTYGWLPPVDSLSKNYFNNDISKENILDAANQQLANLGLQYAKDNPDLLFRYITIVNNKGRYVYGNPYWGMGMGWGYGMGFGPWGMGWGSPWGWGGGPVGREKYRNAHLIIEAVDRESNSVVWQARGTREIRNPERSINKLPEVVEGIFKKYPKN